MTKRLTLNAINKALAAKGCGERLVKGNGYWYFAEGKAHFWPSSSVLVYRLNDLTLEQWLEEHADLSTRRRV